MLPPFLPLLSPPHSLPIPASKVTTSCSREGGGRRRVFWNLDSHLQSKYVCSLPPLFTASLPSPFSHPHSKYMRVCNQALYFTFPLPSSFSSVLFPQPFFSSPLLSSRHRSGPRTSATAGKRESQLQTTGREGQNGSHTLTNFEHVLMSSLCFRSSPSWEVCRSSPSTRICPTPSLMKRYV